MIDVRTTYINLQSYGDRYGYVSSTDRINRAFQDAAYRTLYIPDGTWLIDGPILWDKPMTIITNGPASSIFQIASWFPASQDVLRIDPDASIVGTNEFGWSIDGLCIQGSSGRDAVTIDMDDSAAEFLAKFTMKNCRLQAARRALTFDKAGATPNGLFTSVFERNVFIGGLSADRIISLNRSGDSLTFRDNSITGTGLGVFTAPVSGAAQQVFENNNVTASGGSFYFSGGTQYRVVNNQIEQAVAYTGADDASIVLDGCSEARIEGNNINVAVGGNNISAIRIKGAAVRNRILDGNNITVNVGAGKSHFVLENGIGIDNEIGLAKNTYINSGVGIAVNPTITNNAPTITTIGVVLDRNSTLANAWAASADVNFPQGPYVMKIDDNTLIFFGQLVGGVNVPGTTMFTLPIGCRPIGRARKIAPIAVNGGVATVGSCIVDTAGNVNIGVAFAGVALVVLDGCTIQLNGS